MISNKWNHIKFSSCLFP